MTDDRRPTDEQLLELLKDSLDSDVEVTDDTIDMLMTGYDIVNADVLEAELTFDSLAAGGVRSDGEPTRLLRFEDAEVVIEVELDDVSLRCAGRVAPLGGVLHLEQMSGSRALDLADSGAFGAIVERAGPFRFRYTVDDRSVSTSWLRFGPTDG